MSTIHMNIIVYRTKLTFFEAGRSCCTFLSEYIPSTPTTTSKKTIVPRAARPKVDNSVVCRSLRLRLDFGSVAWYGRIDKSTVQLNPGEHRWQYGLLYLLKQNLLMFRLQFAAVR